MKNRNVGFLIIGISVVIGILIFIFNAGMRDIVSQTCTHGPSCSMYSTINFQTWLSVAVTFIIFVVGLVLIFAKENEKIVVKKIKPYGELKPIKFDKKSISKLEKDEQKLMNLLLKNKGSIFQSELVEKTGFNKVKITRILDSLEGMGYIERKRRGMTNIVILKNNIKGG
jgi:uncharacterized membrane protein